MQQYPGYIKYYGQELNTSTYNLARMNMFLTWCCSRKSEAS